MRNPASSACACSRANAAASDVGRDGTVEHEAPDPLGELLGVGGAELGPVRPAEEVQLVVAEGGPDPVEVAGGVGGADARQPAGVALAAPGREPLRRLDQGGALGVVVGRRVDGVERGGAGVVGAADRRAVVHAARVEADDVVAGRQLGALPARTEERVLHVVGQLEARRAGTTRVDEDRAGAPARARGAHPVERQRDRAAARIGIVERDPQPRRSATAAARVPAEPGAGAPAGVAIAERGAARDDERDGEEDAEATSGCQRLPRPLSWFPRSRPRARHRARRPRLVVGHVGVEVGVGEREHAHVRERAPDPCRPTTRCRVRIGTMRVKRKPRNIAACTSLCSTYSITSCAGSPMLRPDLLAEEAVAHEVARVDAELLAVVALGVGELRVVVAQREPAERHVARLVLHDVRVERTASGSVAMVADDAERRERETLDDHLHRRGTSCPSGGRR